MSIRTRAGPKKASTMKAIYNKAGKEYSVETDSLPGVSQEYLMQYGFDQSLQDCIAGVAKATRTARAKAGDTAEQIMAAIELAIEVKLQKRIAAIVAGTMGLPTVRDPVRTLAVEYVTRGLKKKGVTVTKARFAELVAEKVEKQRAALVAELARRDALELDVDVDTDESPEAEGGFPIGDDSAPVESPKKKGGKK